MLRRVVRHRGVRSAAIALGGCLLAVTYAAQLDGLATERQQWGASAEVLVVVEPVPRGEPVSAAVERRTVPEAVRPPSALSAVAAGAAAAVPLVPGEIVVRERVVDPNSTLAGGAGRVALTLAVSRQVPLVAVGSSVDLYTVDSANFSSRRVAHGVVVLAFTDDDITVAVPEHQVDDVAAASLRPVIVSVTG